MNNRKRQLANFINKYYEKLNLEDVNIEEERISCFKTTEAICTRIGYFSNREKIHSISISFLCQDKDCGVGRFIGKKNNKIKKGKKVKLIIKDNKLIYWRLL